ncbi:hypothetical protein JX266_012777 [Neoarthrinium moseri]|uniref:uncharacterized protein n=1 Tax=Neoarthrinium moseri TaxID=1658444 RepID=UPI001FDBD406|nr:uncharacterized protein JN550_009743 [Neoarthrinium moseri]KAI1840996.1 hypothetical protein JX266_012777 [Neoarthrinium moseri]KAI1863217.1 hypothetical protein JN550_009743 [Neoarthrinium moseri]
MSRELENRTAWLPQQKAYPMTVSSGPVPEPKGTEVLVRVRAVAINPCDWAVQILGLVVKAERYPYINGVDVAGEIVSVGPENTRFNIGDRVTAMATMFFSKGPSYGAFQEYMLGVDPLVAKIPDHVSFKEAAVLPLGLSTAIHQLFTKDGLALDYPRVGTPVNSKGKVVIVWGGSSSVGANAIQTAKAAGYTVAATASKKNFGLMEEIGVDYIFDYNSDNVVEEIVATLKNREPLAGIFDAIILESTIRACADIASKLEGNKHVGTVLAPGMPLPTGTPEGVKLSLNELSFIESEVGRAIWVDWLSDALADGSMKCKPNPELVGRGLEKIQDAVDLMGKGVSAKKLAVEL